MGMDMYLYRAKNKKQFNEEDFWNNCKDLSTPLAWENDNYDSPAMLWYARKFWPLLEKVFPDYDADMCGKYVEVDKETLEEMIDFACHHPDYFGDFNTVPELCRALHSYDDAQANGYIYFMECDW